MPITGGNSLLDVNMVLTKIGLTEGMRLADLGCGASGHFVFPSARIVGPRGKVYAVDIMKIVLESINKRKRQENLQNMETVWSNLEVYNATDIESASLDIALLINTLYQSPKRKEIVREAGRLVKKDGRLVVIEWKNVSSPIGPPANDRVNKNNLVQFAKTQRLNLEEEFFAGSYHYGLIFVKI
jgi:ubiquinone/menaquinone biosynthesis C-methylase UbiE